MFVKQLVQRAGRQGVLDARPRHHRQRVFLSKALEDSWQDHSPHLPVVSPLSLAVLIFYCDLSPGQGSPLEFIVPRDRVAGPGPKPPEAAGVKSPGGERSGKGRPRAGQVWSEKTNASEPPMRCRKRRDVTETRLQSLAWDPAETGPAYGLGGDRHKGGVISVLALAGNVGSWSPRCQGKATRGRPLRATLPRRGTGSDQPIVALKPGNAGGAKGLNGSALWDGSTRKGRNSCWKRGRVCCLPPRLSINPQGEES